MDALVLGTRKLGMGHTSASQDVTHEGEVRASLRRERAAFAAKVRAARAALGWTQRELGSRVPLTQSSVYKMEQGTHDLRRSTAVRVEQVLKAEGIEFEDLPGGGFKIVVRESTLSKLLDRFDTG